eukprot:9302965-Pyramimonas_sp.AAC.1
MKRTISALEIAERCVGFVVLELISDTCFARAVHKAGGIVCIEWSTQCKYWRGPQVKGFMRELEFVKTALHGCAYGLKDSKGNFMKNPWAIATTSSVVGEGLERRCDGAHGHVEARG